MKTKKVLDLIPAHEAAIKLLKNQENVLAIARMYAPGTKVPVNAILELLNAFKEVKKLEKYEKTLNIVDNAIYALEEQYKVLEEKTLEEAFENAKKIFGRHLDNDILNWFDEKKVNQESSNFKGKTNIWIFPKAMSNKEIIASRKEAKNYVEIPLRQFDEELEKLLKNGELKRKKIIIYLSTKNKDGNFRRLNLWRDYGNRLGLSVYILLPEDEWYADDGVLCDES